MRFKIGDIVRAQHKYLKITRIDGDKCFGTVVNSLTEAMKSPLTTRRSDGFYREYELTLVKSIDGEVIPEFEKMQRLSRREQIIYLANKYKDRLLEKDFLKDNNDYGIIARDLSITTGDLYTYLTFKLKLNKLSNRRGDWGMQSWYYGDPEKRKKIEEEKAKQIEEEAVFGVKDVWKLLAYYCKYHSIQEAKSALSRFERLFYKKDWDRIREMWTPLFYPDYDYMQSKMIVCKIINRRKGFKFIYDAELLDDGMGETGMEKKQYLNRKCLVIAKDKDNERIDYLLKQGSIVKIVGNKEKPFRNKTSDILKITTIKRR